MNKEQGMRNFEVPLTITIPVSDYPDTLYLYATLAHTTLMKKKLLITVFLFGWLVYPSAQTNDSALASEILRSIANAQVSIHDEFYRGSFPSSRECAGFPHNYRPDNNIFFTAITVFTLQHLVSSLTPHDSSIAAQIIGQAQNAFPYYRDATGLPLYSFWPRGKGILPHSLFIRKIKLIDMGQDADDAVMSLMATGASDSVCMLLKHRMMVVSNMGRKKTNITLREYRDIPAYSTWLGFSMKPDFDLGVHCNILYFVFEKRLPLAKQDSATIQLIAKILAARRYKSMPAYISPYYARTPVLMYQLARLMGRFHIPELDACKTQLIADMEQELGNTNSLMDRIILSTSLLRLGAKPPLINIATLADFEKNNTGKFVFFQARAAFSYPSPFKQWLLHWSYMCYYFYCPAYNKVLWLEYLAERNKDRLHK